MPELEIELTPKSDPRLYELSVKTDAGFLVGEIGDPKVIADKFGKTSNPARWKLLRSLDGPIAWLFEMKVVKGMRGRGLGTDLLAAALEVLVENDVQYAVLSHRPESPEDRQRLIRFYERFGFEEILEFKGEKLWSPIMVKDLIVD